MLAQVLVLLGQLQPLAEVRGVLVDGEARAQRGDLEQHAARLAEVDRLEVVAIADVAHVAAGGGDPLLPREMVLVARAPSDVVDRARALRAARGRRRVVGPVEAAFGALEHVLARTLGGEAERGGGDAPRDLRLRAW